MLLEGCIKLKDRCFVFSNQKSQECASALITFKTLFYLIFDKNYRLEVKADFNDFWVLQIKHRVKYHLKYGF